MWRIMAGLHEEVTILFLPVGHSKVSTDWCFGLAKQSFCQTKVNNLDDIANSVSSSSFVNVPQLVGTLDGTCYVPTYNWSKFFEQYTIKTALKGIKGFQHGRYDSLKLSDYCKFNTSCTRAHSMTLVPPQSTINSYRFSFFCEHSIFMEHCPV